ncbi:PepSY-like domain-containing protein [Flavobacterium sp. JP2137]|uniref:PepSY-like domain-containing protein n=1 Tax=Flavobacterium sp. JP2137 TaxID=3414510 RepID=UPI003D2FB358
MKSTAINFLTALFLFIGMSAQAQESIITATNLPQPAQKFVADHFSKCAIAYVKKDKETFSTDYKVKFADGKEVEFDAEGNWTEVDGNKTVIPTAFIKKNILTYIEQMFPNTQIVKIEKGRFGKQEVKLNNGLELEFNSKGAFKRIDD